MAVAINVAAGHLLALQHDRCRRPRPLELASALPACCRAPQRVCRHQPAGCPPSAAPMRQPPLPPSDCCARQPAAGTQDCLAPAVRGGGTAAAAAAKADGGRREAAQRSLLNQAAYLGNRQVELGRPAAGEGDAHLGSFCRSSRVVHDRRTRSEEWAGCWHTSSAKQHSCAGPQSCTADSACSRIIGVAASLFIVTLGTRFTR